MSSPLLRRRMLANRRPTNREERLRRAFEDDVQRAEVLRVQQSCHKRECNTLSADVQRLSRCITAHQRQYFLSPRLFYAAPRERVIPYSCA